MLGQNARIQMPFNRTTRQPVHAQTQMNRTAILWENYVRQHRIPADASSPVPSNASQMKQLSEEEMS